MLSSNSIVTSLTNFVQIVVKFLLFIFHDLNSMYLQTKQCFVWEKHSIDTNKKYTNSKMLYNFTTIAIFPVNRVQIYPKWSGYIPVQMKVTQKCFTWGREWMKGILSVVIKHVECCSVSWFGSNFSQIWIQVS